jgi:AcrR family transcriptional regulator
MSSEVRPTLRERQAEQVRRAVLDAVVAQLEDKAVDDISMGDVAAAAGVSLRTLYRYFPDRASLLNAAGERLYGSLGVPYDIAGPDDVSASFLEAARRLSTRPALTRALVQTTAGRAARSGLRRQRVAAIRTALKPLTDGLDPDTGRRATAVIAHLCSAASWVAISDDSGLDDADAQQAAAWAIDTLIAALRTSRRARRRPGL